MRSYNVKIKKDVLRMVIDDCLLGFGKLLLLFGVVPQRRAARLC